MDFFLDQISFALKIGDSNIEQWENFCFNENVEFVLQRWRQSEIFKVESSNRAGKMLSHVLLLSRQVFGKNFRISVKMGQIFVAEEEFKDDA